MTSSGAATGAHPVRARHLAAALVEAHLDLDDAALPEVRDAAVDRLDAPPEHLGELPLRAARAAGHRRLAGDVADQLLLRLCELALLPPAPARGRVAARQRVRARALRGKTPPHSRFSGEIAMGEALAKRLASAFCRLIARPLSVTAGSRGGRAAPRRARLAATRLPAGSQPADKA